MDTFSQVTGQIGQGGRRGALMISISCDHPDFEDFINIKSDLNRVNYANISVRVTDDFMQAVIDDDDWELKFERKETGEVISKTVRAKDIFHLLCKQNWDYAEPGILFWDRISNWNILSEDEEFEYAGTNPCIVGSTLISTTDGEIPIMDLVGQNPDVYCMDNNGNIAIRKATKVWKTRKNAEIVRVKTHRGFIDCTPDHKIYTRNRGWVEAKDIKHGDRLTGLNRSMKDEIHVSVGLTGGKYIPEHRLVAGYYYDISNKDVHHIDGDTLNNTIGNLQVISHSEHSALSNTGRKIESIRDDFGRYMKKPKKSSRNSFNLNCGVGTNWFVDEVEFLNRTEDVYDMTVEEFHNFVANRIVVHNCAEEPLPPGGSCLLGSINLAEFVDDDRFDFDAFGECVHTAVIALNDVLDEGQPRHPLTEQRNSVHDWRQIGLGVMGIADMLIKLGIRYGSKESIDLCDDIGFTMAGEAILTSSSLAKDNGAFEKYKECVLKSPYFIRNTYKIAEQYIKTYGLRNSQLLTIAPTGTLSTMIGVSGGIEPIFANYYTRMTKSLHGEDVEYKVYTPIVKQYMEQNNITDDSELPDYFVTAKDIDFNDRIAMQAIWQEHIDASISSTINVPNEFTVEQVEQMYINAWESGLKGLTMFREGCARMPILSTEEKKEETVSNDSNELKRGDVEPPRQDLIGLKRDLTTGCGSLHVSAYFDPQTCDLKECFLSKGSNGGCNNYMIGLSRLISLSARAGVSVEAIVDQLNSTGVCPSYAVRHATKKDTSVGSCCAMAVGNALMDMWHQVKDVLEEPDEHCNSQILHEEKIAKCPECGEPLIFEGGCNICKSCGWSKCL